MEARADDQEAMSYKTVKLPAELVKRLKVLAAQKGTTIQALAEEIIRKYLREQER